MPIMVAVPGVFGHEAAAKRACQLECGCGCRRSWQRCARAANDKDCGRDATRRNTNTSTPAVRLRDRYGPRPFT